MHGQVVTGDPLLNCKATSLLVLHDVLGGHLVMRKPVTSASGLVLKEQDTALRPGQVPLAPQPTPN